MVLPCSIKSVQFPDAPVHHEVHTSITTDRTFDQLVHEDFSLNPIDYTLAPEASPVTVMLSAFVNLNGDDHSANTSVDIGGAQVRVTISGSSYGPSISYWANPGQVTANRKVGEYTLQPDEVFLNASVGVTQKMTSAEVMPETKMANVYSPAKNVTTAAVRGMIKELERLATSGVTDQEPKDAIEARLRGLAGRCGVQLSEEAFKKANEKK